MSLIAMHAGVMALDGWTPAALPGLSAWYVADNPGNTLVSGELSVLADKSGSGNPAPVFGNAIANRAVLVPGGLNGRTIWRSDSATRRGAFSPGGLNMSRAVAGITLAVVHRTNPAQGAADLNVIRINRSGGTFARAMIGKGFYGTNVVYAGGRRLDANAFDELNDGVDHGTDWTVSIAVLDYAAAAALLDVNGALTTDPAFLTPGLTSNTAASTHGLGHSGSGPAANSAYGDYAEALMIMTALAPADRDRLRGYLAWQWGLQGSLPPGDPYKTAPP